MAEDKVILDDEIETPKENKKEKHSKLEKEIALLREELGNKVSELEEYKNKYMLNLAETQNFKKRMNDEAIKDRKYATYDLSKGLIEVLDAFDLALNKEVSEELASYLDGFRIIKDKISTLLEKEGVTKIDSLDKTFDPNFHHAIMTESVMDKENGIITRVYQEGYLYKDRVLRPAMVVINQKEENKDSKEEE